MRGITSKKGDYSLVQMKNETIKKYETYIENLQWNLDNNQLIEIQQAIMNVRIVDFKEALADVTHLQSDIEQLKQEYAVLLDGNKKLKALYDENKKSFREKLNRMRKAMEIRDIELDKLKEAFEKLLNDDWGSEEWRNDWRTRAGLPTIENKA